MPSRGRRITIIFNEESLSGTDYLAVQIGDSGGIETTGYVGTSNTIDIASATGGTNSTSYFPINFA
jgi:hypothetical protein